MTHKTFKVSIVINDLIENFYIKHYVDEYQPIFNKFKSLVFQRNPMVNVPILKIYWIDAENDQILVSCEEDFRLYIEQGQGKKIFFSVINANKQKVDDNKDEEDEAMEAEEPYDRQKCARRSKKIAREEEKQKRCTKRLADKMKLAEEKLRIEEERRARCPDFNERKNAERLEKAKRRCEKLRMIIGSFDPANLSSTEFASNVQTTTPSASADRATGVEAGMSLMNPSPETMRLLSNAIAGCLQPCNLINKILTDIIGMVPQPVEETTAPSSGQATREASSGSTSASNGQQQQTEFLRQNSATNTSDLNSPVASGHQSNPEIEALFKEAAKELQKMNDIVNNTKALESSSGSMGSSTSAITQVERFMQNMTESTISNATLVDVEPSSDVTDKVDGTELSHSAQEDFKVITPNKSMRSRESSIEIHDVNSVMSDDSRDWTMLDAVTNEDEQADQADIAAEPLIVESAPSEQVIWKSPVVIPIEDPSIEKVTEPVKPEASSATSAKINEDVRASIQQSIDNAAKMNAFVKNSVALAQETLKNEIFQQMERDHMNLIKPMPVINRQEATASSDPSSHCSAPCEAESVPIVIDVPTPLVPTPAIRNVPINVTSATTSQDYLPLFPKTQANLMAAKSASGGAKPKVPEVGRAVIVYDPNPKINAAVHSMMAMGFSNEGGWLTQLLLNVDGDVPAAINFLTPQPKKQK